MITDESQYHDLLQSVMDNGIETDDRTGTGTISLFRPKTMVFDLNGGLTFPLLTKKKVNYKAVLNELLWFISGSTNVKDLNSKIWDEWKDEHGNIGPMYGFHFRKIYDTDPLKDTIDNIKNNPTSRRHVMTTWNHKLLPDENLSPQENIAMGNQSLANCHGTVIQFYVEENKLSLSHYQRSGDLFIGVPFNIASYAFLLMMVAHVTGYEAHKLYFDIGDAHIYKNHLDQVREYLDRDIKMELPWVNILDGDPFPDINGSIDNFKVENFGIISYDPQPFIKAPISV